MKAHLRLGKAEILCVNYPAAVSHLNVLLDFAHRCKNLCDIDALRNQVETISKALLKYASKDDTVLIPRPVTMALAAAMPNYFCRMVRLMGKRKLAMHRDY
ncbi:hypothetical protein WJX75_008509 [Coccomyxa subellipsoidea]|uniref:Uncharacterized protein n=1 Tax=Coccomyxa subellipsoidea TaxID=248742 RepID=A0ABR2YBP1_9CHLO